MVVPVYEALTNCRLQSRYLTKPEHYYDSLFSWSRMGESHLTFDSRVKMANGVALGDTVTE